MADDPGPTTVQPRGSLPDDAGTDAELDDAIRVGEGDLDAAEEWLEEGGERLAEARAFFGAGLYEGEQ